MSITPNEIETMEEAVKAATGKVIVYGLGLGYYPYMISLKDEVKEIVIVENDIKIINLFKLKLVNSKINFRSKKLGKNEPRAL